MINQEDNRRIRIVYLVLLRNTFDIPSIPNFRSAVLVSIGYNPFVLVSKSQYWRVLVSIVLVIIGKYRQEDCCNITSEESRSPDCIDLDRRRFHSL